MHLIKLVKLYCWNQLPVQPHQKDQVSLFTECFRRKCRFDIVLITQKRKLDTAKRTFTSLVADALLTKVAVNILINVLVQTSKVYVSCLFMPWMP